MSCVGESAFYRSMHGFGRFIFFFVQFVSYRYLMFLFLLFLLILMVLKYYHRTSVRVQPPLKFTTGIVGEVLALFLLTILNI